MLHRLRNMNLFEGRNVINHPLNQAIHQEKLHVPSVLCTQRMSARAMHVTVLKSQKEAI